MSVKSAKDAARAAGGRNAAEPRRTDSAARIAALEPASIRNIALIGHSGAGKTLLIEALLAANGMITRKGSIAEGTTVGDSDPAAVHQQRSVTLSLVPLMLDDTKVNLLDTPGYPDFIGEMRAGLRAADAALFVVSAVDGIDATTTALWAECAHRRLPRAVVITRLDHPRADYDGALAECRKAFGDGVLPLYVPVGSGGERTGLLGLLSGTVTDYSAGESPATRDAPADDAAEAADARGELIEGIIAESEDETLMDRYLSGEDIDTGVLIQDLETAVARGSFHPVIPTSAVTGLGTSELLDMLVRAFPPPTEADVPEATDLEGLHGRSLGCDPSGPLAAEVVRTSNDPFLGRICLVRVFSGTLREDSPVHVGGHGLADRGHQDHDTDERVTHLYSPLGATLRPVPYCVAGDLCALAKLGSAETGDTISSRDDPLMLATWEMPEPLLPVAVEADSRSDEDALARSLGKIAAGDPTMRVERNQETHQLVLWCMGEAHADVVMDRLREQGVKLHAVDVVTPLRETFAGPATGHGRHVKQSGGHGQYAVCDIEVEPLDRGGGFEFVDKTVGGVIPGTFIPSVEKGVRSQMEKGVSAGFPVVDVRVRLVGGKAHSVDSSDAAFQAAGALALREAAAAGRIQLLEPVSAVSITVADEHVGPVMSDLSGRRGRLTGTTSSGGGLTDISAEVPDQELLRYAVELRALTAGTGRFSRSYLRHDPVPSGFSPT
ncbi:small GTP-binding protein [Pseudarthrobacter chlorophenolicus A6]|uniref:Small GTP-binding protein n=1 Tax=Pseudarthrobacter chlorophenolicus (strain ATCC 700700 / DSM 12829 / CIP 107037 / JCM 12360 / KCTC 9906 / NCIMB 13794 / A6) TaxID=452863 RepID=B8HCT4_PSECP|nr:elongation factor G-like protein EF-G2 [Pseudarthrobacter chlorophenolicus]ACL38867.1 small GTP-binding protein [Pseudarthrobacter chlorophenolicus A6]SDR07665.1 translation elongation factor 2 (EF-2/EF-G) [Pseudarthrobacter chlorophenolicus]